MMNLTPDLRRFDVPSIIVHGPGCRRRLPDLVAELGGRRVLIVTDQGVRRLGVIDEAVADFAAAGFETFVFDQVQPDPTDQNVAAGFEAAKTHRVDVIVAIGGGSPIDAAKVIAIREANSQPLPEYMGLHKITRPGLPLIAVPTTAGTGSEATKVAVITDTARQVKMMMLSAALLPRAAIVDFELTLAMPLALTAAVGVDTLTHGIEAYVSKKANPLTDPYALQCVDLVARHLRTACADPQNREAREGMMLAATLGGIAFSNSSVALVHGMSRPLGAVFHLPHGLSNAVLLPAVTRFSVTSALGRYATIARTCGCADAQTPDDLACAALTSWLRDLNRTLNIPGLGECRGVTREVFETVVAKMAQDAIDSGSPGNNPRVPSPEEIVALYREAW